MTSGTIPASRKPALAGLITPTEGGIASRVLAKNGGGNVTLFAFDQGEGLSEHTTPFDALVIVLEGALALTIGGTAVTAAPAPSSACRRTCRTPLTRPSPPGCCW